VRDGVRAALPLVLGPVLFGLTFGVLAEAAGIGVAPAVVMSATTFAGSAQFAAASVLEDGGTVFAAILSAVLLNARYAGMSIAVASIFPGNRGRRFLESQLIVDESWALSGRSGRFEWPVLVGAGLFLYVLWVASTALGSIVGDVLGDPNDLGLDAAFAALFLALARPYLHGRKALQAAALAGVITLVLLPVAPAGVPLVVAAIACLIGVRR
jgi:4-azaleucine resistance transporter AzlC